MEALDQDIEAALSQSDASGEWRSGSLPFHLGLSAHQGARWSDFVQLPPNRDLPTWVGDACDSASRLPPQRVEAFDRAHHLAAGWGIVADRMDDGQLDAPTRFECARGHLLDAWGGALRHACGDLTLAQWAIADALRAWQEGTAIERAFFARRAGAASVQAYARSIRLRLRWVSVGAVVMLITAGRGDRVAAFRAAHEAFMFGLQCRDDAFDADADRAVWGVSVHEALGVPRGALVRAAPAALRRAASLASSGGFARFGAWVSAFAEGVDVHDDGDLAQNELAAMMLTAALEGAA